MLFNVEMHHSGMPAKRKDAGARGSWPGAHPWNSGDSGLRLRGVLHRETGRGAAGAGLENDELGALRAMRGALDVLG